jgi:hypothetical protein
VKIVKMCFHQDQQVPAVESTMVFHRRMLSASENDLTVLRAMFSGVVTFGIPGQDCS